MIFFIKNINSNLLEQKFSKPSNLISSKILLEIKFEGLENLNDEALLKSFYFFLLLIGRLPTFKNFKSRYHLGKTFYSFDLFTTLRTFNLSYFLSDFLERNLNEPSKANFNSSFYFNYSKLTISDLKIFSLVESNPHFFKWDKELNIFFYFLDSRKNYQRHLDSYFWNIYNLKQKSYENFWTYYVS